MKFARSNCLQSLYLLMNIPASLTVCPLIQSLPQFNEPIHFHILSQRPLIRNLVEETTKSRENHQDKRNIEEEQAHRQNSSNSE